MVSVAYMDPGNYSTAVSSGATYKYALLSVVFLSNIFAVILQCLCIKLGTVTGLDLAEFCRLALPGYINLPLYVCAELAIIATDLAEVVGTAISLQILFGIPLVYGVLITVLDVLIVLFAYHKDGSMKQTRTFEILVSVLVGATCICFVLELFKCHFEPGAFSDIVKGFLPTRSNLSLFTEKQALFLSCAIVGSTVMPHSLYLGSALVQPRLKEYDIKHGNILETAANANNEDDNDDDDYVVNVRRKSISDSTALLSKYKPSLSAIEYCLSYSYSELIISLFIIAVFVNSAILIVAATTLYGKPDAEDADLLSIYEMLAYYISPTAGIIFALSMLFSGQSAGIVCTMAGQIVSEGFINWTLTPWLRRIITRVIAIIPVLVIILIMGREGVSKIMNSSQVVLSFFLPVTSAPLIWFTCTKQYMTVKVPTQSTITVNNDNVEHTEQTALLDSTNTDVITFENSTPLAIASVLTWLTITALNIYLVIASI
ncbi:uncharacterized protein KQ657_002868 [Scheffersomyces spartinae]|uniref:Uncharacterized protein n=1 Tax=Scheffersomyces spartinae TaxID=45513 RepID=A0A9P7V5N2_9ASCO|nr:uncharacterized protein KQ657_002868 [Scheffersomyces spartinae]KAG7191732.1 hypothetical protein KQ657_002868 [Scheffersomyces spartinae]